MWLSVIGGVGAYKGNYRVQVGMDPGMFGGVNICLQSMSASRHVYQCECCVCEHAWMVVSSVCPCAHVIGAYLDVDIRYSFILLVIDDIAYVI